MSIFTLAFTARPEHIDELGHVNNAVWVQWIQDIATAHWASAADPAHIAQFVWVVTRHEIDYRGNIGVGEGAIGRTWISEPPRGARFNRNVAFDTPDGRPLVSAISTWAMIDRASGRPARVRPDMVARFMPGSITD
ncbi:MAG: acyl-CoA thioesterase [Blastomonas sp.]